ncbi:EboA domain-containing protein [Marinimicrobium alkaliphilum]|uniref:EboA domain-containing protein n=1 Tax=Marinimicrobium alkaliphilum TaxID=2202654 RepID=UPI00130022A2|nr:EboA domain-containing protein [Marinimicrobium alkaliphilum]
MAPTTAFLVQLLKDRADEKLLSFWQNAHEELAKGVDRSRFSALISLASRYAKRHPLTLDPAQSARAQTMLPGWTPAAWNELELLRVILVLARPDLSSDTFAEDFETLFRFADEGETCALYRSLPLLPEGERFVWRAGEACRTNMLSVFEAVALDSPYPVTHFDDTAWRQLVIKALFLDCNLARIAGLEQRLDPELTRMALDWAQERKSAGRNYHLGLWLCLGPHHGERVQALLNEHWPDATPLERRAMALGAGRAGQTEWLTATLANSADKTEQSHLRQGAEGGYGQNDFMPVFEAAAQSD